jgi:hypothetical protein
MATFIGAISKRKGSSKTRIEKSLNIIISEMKKLEDTGNFKGVFFSAGYFNDIETQFKAALKAVSKEDF